MDQEIKETLEKIKEMADKEEKEFKNRATFLLKPPSPTCLSELSPYYQQQIIHLCSTHWGTGELFEGSNGLSWRYKDYHPYENYKDKLIYLGKFENVEMIIKGLGLLVKSSYL